MSEENLDTVLRVRLTNAEKEKAERWARRYNLALSTFVRWLIQLLPDNPPEIPKPKINLSRNEAMAKLQSYRVQSVSGNVIHVDASSESDAKQVVSQELPGFQISKISKAKS